MASITISDGCAESWPCKHSVVAKESDGTIGTGFWDMPTIYEWCKKRGVVVPKHIASEYAIWSKEKDEADSFQPSDYHAVPPPQPPLPFTPTPGFSANSGKRALTKMLAGSSGRIDASSSMPTTNMLSSSSGRAGGALPAQTQMMSPSSGRFKRPTTRMLSSTSGRSSFGSMYTPWVSACSKDKEPTVDHTFMLEHASGRSSGMSAENCLHPGVRCDLCNQMMTQGARFKCLDCPDFDLCEGCEAVAGAQHGVGLHTFAKIRDSRKIQANSYLRK